MNRITIALLTIITLTGCGNKNKATINGRFYGESKKMLYLECQTPGRIKVVDSVKSNRKGAFRFKIEFKDENPIFYNIRMGSQFVPLLIAPGENVKLSAVGNIYNNYSVEGSEGSALVRQLGSQGIETTQRLDSLMKLYQAAAEPQTFDRDAMQRIGKEYGETYIQMKRNTVKFIMDNATSMASIIPFYQPIFGNRYIFDQPEDIVYLRLVADSLSNHYPTSPYVLSLVGDVAKIDQSDALDSLINTDTSSGENYIDIELSDELGKTRRLSDLNGKIILLDFVTTDKTEFRLLIRDMVEIYERYSPKGFEIFQVSLDISKRGWLDYLAKADLPWITVCDFRGGESPAARNYNVRSIPANFLIDQSGNIIGKDLYGDQLEKKLSELTAGR